MPVAAITLMGTIVFAFINFLKALFAGDHNAWFTQLLVWLSGIAVVVLFAHSQFGTGINLAGIALVKANMVDQILIGLVAASLLTTVNEVKKAVDNNDTAQTHPLLRWVVKKPPTAVK